MNNVEEIKKYAELKEKGIITEEEYENAKIELLSGELSNIPQNPNNIFEEIVGTFKEKAKRLAVKKLILKIIIVVLIMAIPFIGNDIANNSKKSQRCRAVEEGLQSVMEQYGIPKYKVKYRDYDYDLYIDDLESRSFDTISEILREASDVKVQDPCGEEKISTYAIHVYPNYKADYYYWVDWHGIYCNRIEEAYLIEDEEHFEAMLKYAELLEGILENITTDSD